MKKIQNFLKSKGKNIPESTIKGICKKFRIGVFTNNHKDFIIDYILKNY
jgi:hypothetical protein